MRHENNNWRVNGKSGVHVVLRKNGSFECDCKLFNGDEQYSGQAGECSHIQFVMILELVK